jgi:hypothetical protein
VIESGHVMNSLRLFTRIEIIKKYRISKRLHSEAQNISPLIQSKNVDSWSGVACGTGKCRHPRRPGLLYAGQASEVTRNMYNTSSAFTSLLRMVARNYPQYPLRSLTSVIVPCSVTRDAGAQLPYSWKREDTRATTLV